MTTIVNQTQRIIVIPNSTAIQVISGQKGQRGPKGNDIDVTVPVPSGGNDTSMIQDLLYEGQGKSVILDSGLYKASGLILPPNTTLRTSSQMSGLASFGTAATVIQAPDDSEDEWVIQTENGTSPRNEASALVGVAIDGNFVCGGAHFEGWYGKCVDVHIHNTATVGLDMAGQSWELSRLLVTNTWTSGTPSEASGGTVIDGADHTVQNCEFSGGALDAGFSGGNHSALLVKAGASSFVNVIAEYGDYGWRFTTEAVHNRISNCRADRNWAHGFYGNPGYSVFSACIANDNSQETDATYDGFHIFGWFNTFASCLVLTTLTNEVQYAFYDPIDTANANAWVSCQGYGYAVAEFGGDGFPGSLAHTLRDAALYFTPAITQITPLLPPAVKVGYASLNVNPGQASGFLASFANNDYCEWPINIQAGTYRLQMLGVSNTDAPILDISLDGVLVATFDQYTASLVWMVEWYEDAIVIDAPGEHVLRVTTNGKHASSSGYLARISAIQLIRLS